MVRFKIDHSIGALDMLSILFSNKKVQLDYIKACLQTSSEPGLPGALIFFCKYTIIMISLEKLNIIDLDSLIANDLYLTLISVTILLKPKCKEAIPRNN